ncbi:Trk family potassium uptake protein [Iocasia frigidifontis]|uniref:Trk family potassium uptake protein n=1 Tax=Iocasia fonsfrigidae TaxID=2682810 RepID=A0A8A7KHE9_9FIRM|nr:TrkH family potassium uptake protein [Iocasia fonsfrigidae]QTL98307.1 Trk family potassium uptake protein [Iocasia fonsfrigidae]
MFSNNHDYTPAQLLVLGYLAVIITGTILLMIPAATTQSGGLDIISALFTATSATCVTGLIVVNTSTAFTVFGQLVIMILIQIGGLGLMTMSTMVAFIIGKKISLKERLLIQEDLNQFKISGLVALVRYVLIVTFVIEGIGALILFLRLLKDYSFWKAIYYAIFHAISAFNNAGFDLFGNSLEGFTGDIFINLAVIFLIILGGLGFAVLAELYNKRDIKKTSLQTKIVITISLILIIVGFISFLALEYNNELTMGNLSFGEKTLSALFLSVTPRTAGFNTIPTGSLKSSTLFLVIVLMFIGASPGSTGGGIKTTTFGVLLITVWSMITGKRDIEIFKRQLENEIIFKALSITILSLMLVVLVTMILTVSEGMDFLPVFFETVSAFGTVGLSTGITSALSSFGRLMITITMFAGRVGPLTLALAFAERKRSGVYHYPKEKIMVG